MSDDELKLTRRLFLQHSAMASAMAGAAMSIAMKTDALAQADDRKLAALGADDTSPYPYLLPEHLEGE